MPYSVSSLHGIKGMPCYHIISEDLSPMDPFSDQCAALAQVWVILEGVGLSLDSDLELITQLCPSSWVSLCLSTPSHSHYSSPSPAVSTSQYLLPPACLFTQDEINQWLYKINSKLLVHWIVIHPPDAIVEYLQTSESKDVAIAHIFPINPNSFENPKSGFQYLLGVSHGGWPHINCSLLTDDNGKQVLYNWTFFSCRYIIWTYFHTKFHLRSWPQSLLCPWWSVNGPFQALIYKPGTSLHTTCFGTLGWHCQG